MNCERAQSLWHDKCDSELSPSDAMSLEFHLRQCSACRQFHLEMDDLADGLDELRVATEAVGIPAARHSPVRFTSRWWAAVGSVAAMVAVVVSAALWSLQEHPGRINGGQGVTDRSGAGTEEFPVSVEMIGPSRERYIPVRSESDHPGVRFFVLYEQATDDNS